MAATAKRLTATLVLGCDGMGPDADDDDFCAWVDYVTDRIDEASGCEVEVEIRGPRDVQSDAARGDGAHLVREAKERLWEAFCADTNAWPSRAR